MKICDRMTKSDDKLKQIFIELESLKNSNDFRDLKRVRLLRKEIDIILDAEQDIQKSDASLDEEWEKSRRR